MPTPIIMPRQGQSVETCVITEWLKKKGEKVKSGEILFSYETDKAAFEQTSPADGTLLEIFFDEGDEVPVLVNVAVIGNEGEPVDEFRPEASAGAVEEKIDAEEPSSDTAVIDQPEVEIPQPGLSYDEKQKISPRAKRLAERLKIPIHQIRGTGPEGRIIEKDIEDVAKITPRMTSLASEVTSKENKIPGVKTTGLGGRTRASDLEEISERPEDEFIIQKISNIRKIIAENMFNSLQNSAQLTHHISADARKILEYRKKFKAEDESSGETNITINDMVCYSVIRALKNKPRINSHFLGDSIKTFTRVHLGIAVDTERGLMVPVLRCADDLTLKELSFHLKDLANRAKKGNIDPGLLQSTAASFTVTNLGAYGIEMFTPVLNLPQTGILGISTIIQRPGDLGNGIVGFIPYIGLSLTYDHRAIDGAPASAFLKEVKDQIEQFEPVIE